MSLDVGSVAPDFTLKSQHGEDITLSSFRGDKNVLLVFIPFAFSGICSDELGQLRDDVDAFEAADTQILAVSCDHFFANRAFSDRDGLTFPILSDFWPHGEVAKAYDTFNDRCRSAQPWDIRDRSGGDREVEGADGDRRSARSLGVPRSSC